MRRPGSTMKCCRRRARRSTCFPAPPTPVTPTRNRCRPLWTRPMDRPPERRIRVERLMGTVISIDLRDAHIRHGVLDEAFAWLRLVEERFSPFIAGSDISRLGRGEWTLEQCHPDVATVLSLCEDLRQ